MRAKRGQALGSIRPAAGNDLTWPGLDGLPRQPTGYLAAKPGNTSPDDRESLVVISAIWNAAARGSPITYQVR